MPETTSATIPDRHPTTCSWTTCPGSIEKRTSTLSSQELPGNSKILKHERTKNDYKCIEIFNPFCQDHWVCIFKNVLWTASLILLLIFSFQLFVSICKALKKTQWRGWKMSYKKLIIGVCNTSKNFKKSCLKKIINIYLKWYKCKIVSDVFPRLLMNPLVQTYLPHSQRKIQFHQVNIIFIRMMF